jgi:hypothetical protein
VVRDKGSKARDSYQCCMILVRPDQFIAWTGDAAPRDAEALMRRVAGA